MKTDAAVLSEINQPLQIEELTIPSLKKGQVLVETAYSGICHSQLNEIYGLKGEDKYLPHTLGHEGSGIVAEVGPAVTKVKPGDHVVMTWIKGWGHDVPSTHYQRSDGSVVNSGAISTFMNKAVVSENRLVPISKDMPLMEAALLGCAIPTGAGIVKNMLQMQPGQSIALWGLGGIGLSALIMAAHINSRSEETPTVIAIDMIEEKLALAREIGATHTINARSHDPLDAIMGVTSGRGVDYSVEAVGQPKSMELAFRSVHDQGGLCVLAGNLPQGETISLDPFDLIRGKRILGAWGGGTNPDTDIPLYEKAFLSGKINLTTLVSLKQPLRQINDAIQAMEAGQVGRCLIEMACA